MRSILLAPQRAIRQVPRWVLALLMLTLVGHAMLRHAEPRPQGVAETLDAPLPLAAWRMLSLGEPQAAAQALTLYLQAFDNQPGISIPYAALDFSRVIAWLKVALALDADTQYPLMMASQLYGQVTDNARSRRMCDFVHEAFGEKPNARWRWLAHCAIMARHRLQDMPLALRYAEDIARQAGHASGWARQMRIFMLADMGETQRAKILLGGLLAGNEVSDPKELHFLTEQLERMESNAVSPVLKN